MHRTSAVRPVLAILAAAALAGVGCGSEPRVGGSTTPATPDEGVAFSACVRAHGVADFPDPDAEGEYAYGVSVTPEVFTRAVDACEDLRPPGALSSKRTPEQRTASLAFADCVREHGVEDFPDPVDGEPAINTYEIPSSNTPNGMTVLNAAIEACRSVSGLER